MAKKRKSANVSKLAKTPEAPLATAKGNDSPETSSPFPIVGIGASAGGLAALKQFFAHVAKDSGLAYVVVVHLSPEHKSHLAELLQPHIQMPVQQVAGTVALERNHVYVIPPNANLNTIDTHLRLSELEERRQQRAPIDHFFRTLAKTHDGDAIGVILTGTGSDGTLGLREIKECGGLTIVQDPNEAEYDGMPQSAISTGLVDLVLPLSDIPKAVIQFSRIQPKLPEVDDGEEVADGAKQMLQRMFAQLRARTGRDFGRYKRSTILRRIQRRMQLRQIEEFAGYLELLREEPEEVRTLADDLLITVTSFFRDPEVFEAFERDVIPRLFGEKSPEEEIRVWSVGCATGEEAYSLAILLVEEAARREVSPRLQVFASDLHEHSLKQARDGFYPGDIETDVSPERLKRFFVKENGGYRIRKELREMVIFSPHNLLSDPPFSRLDMVSCRNLMIYIQREVQRDIIELFHYALKPDGYLLLGTSETVDASDLFRIEDKKFCIYQKRNVPAPEPRLPVFPMMRTNRHGDLPPAPKTGEPMGYGAAPAHGGTLRLADALVNSDDKLVHLSEHAGRYLTHPGGEPTTSIIKSVREELRTELRTILRAARDHHRPQRSKPIPVKFDGETRPVVLHVRPNQEPQQDGFILVIFDEREGEPASDPRKAVSENAKPPGKESKKNSREAELESELAQTQQRLQAIIEEYETSQEEMKASNEEMQSTNEELRSTMEELETSKEELQSMNEELQTVNQENRHKVEELAQLTSDLQNLLSATDIATLFLDRDLRIMRFTPKVGELFNVRTTDRGRPLSDLTHNLGYNELNTDAKRVLEKLVPIEQEVGDASGHWYLTRIMPYRSTVDRIEGVVITFVDITSRKKSEQELVLSKDRYRALFNSIDEGFCVIEVIFDDARNAVDYRFLEANPAFSLQTGIENPIGRHMREIAPDHEEHWYELYGQIALTGRSQRFQKPANALGCFYDVYAFRVGDPEERRVAVLFRDITDLKQAENALKDADRRKDEFLATLAHELRNPLAPICTALEMLKMADNKTVLFDEVYGTLERQTQHLVRLIDDLLDVSRITRGKLELRKSPIPLSEVVKAAVEESKPLIDEAGHEFKVAVPKEPIFLDADPHRLAQVLSNLLNNAAKYTPRGGRVELLAEKHNSEILLSVKDNGVGIPLEMQDRVFEIFSQIHQPTEIVTSGLGIGLSLVKSLVEIHGGSIELLSDGPNQGSEFRIRLPILTNPPAEFEPTGPSDEAELSTPKRRVLVVDDNETIRAMSQRMIEMLGHTVRTASDGEEAVAVAEEFRPEVVLMDLGMPNMDGCEAARQIRQKDWGQEITLVALSGWGQEKDRLKSEAAGFDHHLVKPAASADIKRLIAQTEQKCP